MGDRRWVLTYETGPVERPVPMAVDLRIGQSVLAGRHGELPVGVDVPDQGISRCAATVTATAEGWRIDITNKHGAVLHPWGQAPSLAGSHLVLAWPRIAILLLNGSTRGGPRTEDVQHWLLMEADTLNVTPRGPNPTANTTSRTYEGEPPPPLTAAQHEAINAVFADFLGWPPLLRPEPRKLAAAARRLGISEAGVKDRLSNARDKATQLGGHRQVGLTDPEYLYTLIGAGYLRPPTNRIDRRVLPGLP